MRLIPLTDRFDVGIIFLGNFGVRAIEEGRDYIVRDKVPQQCWAGLEAYDWYTDDGGTWSYRPNLGEAVEWVYPTFTEGSVSIR